MEPENICCSEKQELNERLTRHFLGLRKIHYDEWDTEKQSPMYIPSGKPWRTHRIDARPVPNFADPDYGIAYCFKLLVPQLPEGYSYLIFRDGFYWVAEIHGVDSIAIADSLGLKADNPGLALSFAIGKLIDGR